LQTPRRRLLLASQPLTAGVPRHVSDLVDLLDPDRFEVDVACPRRSSLWESLAGRPNVALHEVPPPAAPRPVDVVTLRRLIHLVRRADLVHVHSSKLGFLGRLAARLSGRERACLFTPHAWSFWAFDGTAGQACERLERAAARWCARILTVSEDERRAGLERRIGEAAQYRVVRNGIDLSRFERDPTAVPGRVLFFARAGRQKRVDLALQAADLAAETVPGLELHLVGEDTEAGGQIERLVRERAGRAEVRLLGVRSDVPQLLAESACVLVTSDYEGLPLGVIEAMAAGVPVVASRAGGMSELVVDGETGALFERGDVHGAARELARIAGDGALASRLGQRARAVARTAFSRERMVAEIAAIYDELPTGAVLGPADRSIEG
jgi:glycosyltransferase involved in cell wall biosynthesis